MTSAPQLRATARPGGERGFTLVEVLVVIVVLGILSGLAAFGSAKFRSGSQTSACLAEAATVAVAADAYDATTGTFPTSVDQLVQGRYLKSAPVDAVYVFDPATKTATRAPECARNEDPSRRVTGLYGLCLDLGDTAPANGTAVLIRTCDGRVSQRWTAPASWPGTVMVLGKCLDVEADGTVNYSNIQLHACDGTASQQWVLDPLARLRNVPSSRCLDVPGLDPSQSLIIWDCHDGQNQMWTFF